VLLLVTVISSTYQDFRTRKLNGGKNNFLRSFSLYTNGKKLFSFEQERSDTISCLNGIRVLSTFGVIFAHSIYFRIITPFRDENYLNEWSKTSMAATFPLLTVSVDNFFVISGLLTAKTMLKELDKYIKFYSN
jgi:peptidoglycan/LPS O-acetylase OafA/YrhL